MNRGRPAVLLVGDTLMLGGTEGQFAEIVCRLDRARWEVHAACLLAEGPFRARLEAVGVRAWSCGPGSFRSPRYAASVWRLARYVRRNGIRLVHTFDFYSNLLGIPAARLAGTSVVIASQRDLGDVRPRLQQRVQGFMLRRADYVFVNSKAVAERIAQDSGVASNRIAIVLNGVDLVRFQPVAEFRHSRDGLVIGTLANFRPEKGLQDLVNVAALVRERYPYVRFRIWGDGPLRARVQETVSARGLETSVEVPGGTAGPEVALRDLDIFVLPCLSNEGCSNALLEAMATALPVVATEVGGNPELVEDEVTGLLVPPGDPVALAKAIVRLIEDPGLAARLGEGARQRVEAEFALDRLLKRVEALYERVLAGGRA